VLSLFERLKSPDGDLIRRTLPSDKPHTLGCYPLVEISVVRYSPKSH
jgi:hypothetical protein